MDIRPAKEQEFDAVRYFYHSLIDAMKDAQYRPGWKKGVYPSDAGLRKALAAAELFIGLEGDRIASAMIVNHDVNEGYLKASWPTEARPEEVMVIHALGVHPDFSGMGYAKELVAKAILTAKEQGRKAVRLDVLSGNIPAERLYTGMGFQYVDALRMYYEDTGWTQFKLFEYPL